MKKITIDGGDSFQTPSILSKKELIEEINKAKKTQDGSLYLSRFGIK